MVFIICFRKGVHIQRHAFSFCIIIKLNSMDKSKKSTLEGMATYDTLSAEPTNESETVSEILKMPQFKKRNKSVRLSGNVSSIDNTNLTEILKTMLIDRNICTEKDFK